jgi:hypothetical protein
VSAVGVAESQAFTFGTIDGAALRLYLGKRGLSFLTLWEIKSVHFKNNPPPAHKFLCPKRSPPNTLSPFSPPNILKMIGSW